MAEHKPLKVFYSYSHKDEEYKEDLERHLSGLRYRKLIETWCDSKIAPGTDWESEIISKLETSDIILLLISSDFINSDYCYSEEMDKAIRWHQEGKARVIPILVRPVFMEELPFSRLQILPSKVKAVQLWSSYDEAWVNVVEGIRRAIDDLNVKRKKEHHITQINNKPLKGVNADFSKNTGLLTKSHQKDNLQQENKGKKVRKHLTVSLRNIDARAQRLKYVACQPIISSEEANATIEETENWLEEHRNDTNIRQAYLSLIEKKGTYSQVQQTIKGIELWLGNHQNNTNVRAQYIKLVTNRANAEKARITIKETKSWIDQHKKDESVLLAYLGLVEQRGTDEQLRQAVNNVENWCPKPAQSRRLSEKLSKLRKQLESEKHGRSVISKAIDPLEIAQFDIDTLAQYLSRLAKSGTPMECEDAIEDTRHWLDKHDWDTNIRQVYLRLVGNEGIDEILVQKALKETETWLLKKEHYSNTSVRQAYLSLVRRRGTPTQQRKALKDTEMWLDCFDSVHIRQAYLSLVRATEKEQRITFT